MGQTFLLFGYVNDHEGYADYYTVLVLLGTSASVVTNTTAANAPIIGNYSSVLMNNETWIFPVSTSINQTGTNLKLVFELWLFNSTSLQFQYTGLFDQLYLNVTRT